MTNRFQFYEVVVVAEFDDSNLKLLIGQEGTILAMAKDKELNRWSYSVSMASTGDVWTFDEEQLKPTGRRQERCDLYSGDVVKVQVDPNTGRGSVR